MRRHVALLLVILGGAVHAQTPSSDIPATTIRVATRMVLIDVIATDKNGKSVIDLEQSNFSVIENGKPQKIAEFRFEARRESGSFRSLPPPPQHVFTNRPEYRAPAGPLTVVLLDGLNTPVRDQLYARQQLLKYLKTQLRPDQHIAVFALTSRLRVLQDFTSDPELLRRAIEAFAAQDSRQLLMEQEGVRPTPADLMANQAYQAAAGALRAMLLERASIAYGERVAATLSAFRAIARALGGYQGRKNLVWISAAFPMIFTAESSIRSAGDAQRVFVDRSFQQETRETARQLAEAQVSVYPVDARGLVGASIVDASGDLKNEQGKAYSGQDFGGAISQSNSTLLASQSTVEQIAVDTGGIAYMNQNEIDHAVALSASDGTSYYGLAYYPSDKNWDEKFRAVQVKVDRPGVHLRYRRGYYAVDALKDVRQKPNGADPDLASIIQGEFIPATMVTFDARVIPPAPSDSMSVPVEFLVDTNTLSYEPTPNGGRRYLADFHVAAFAPNGKLIVHIDRRLEAAPTREEYERLRQQGLPFRTSLDLPPGRYQLRLVVRDSRTGSPGSLEIPLVLDSRR